MDSVGEVIQQYDNVILHHRSSSCALDHEIHKLFFMIYDLLPEIDESSHQDKNIKSFYDMMDILDQGERSRLIESFVDEIKVSQQNYSSVFIVIVLIKDLLFNKKITFDHRLQTIINGQNVNAFDLFSDRYSSVIYRYDSENDISRS